MKTIKGYATLALLLLTLALWLALVGPTHARERTLHGWGPEGEELSLSYKAAGSPCHPGEYDGHASWPSGLVLWGCWQVQGLPPYRAAVVRFREAREGVPMEWSRAYLLQSLDLQYH